MRSSSLLLTAGIILFSSCTLEKAHRYIYASQAGNINYLKQKGDSKIAGYYSGDGIKKMTVLTSRQDMH